MGFGSDWSGPCWMAVGLGLRRSISNSPDLARSARGFPHTAENGGLLVIESGRVGWNRVAMPQPPPTNPPEPAAERCSFLLSESFGGQIPSFYPGKRSGGVRGFNLYIVICG